MQQLLTRLGLGRRDLRAWAMYDWANSAFQTTIIAAIFPIYFQKVAAADLPGPVATARFAWGTTISIIIVAVVAPLLRDVPEPRRQLERDETPSGNALATAARRLVETFQELRRYRQAFFLLLAFLLYNDGIQTIIRMATTYGTEIGIDDNAMIGALLVTQFIGVPFAFLFGMFAGKVGAKAAVFVGLAVYALITVLGYFMHSAREF